MNGNEEENIKILIIDSNLENAKLVRMALEENPLWSVKIANNLKSAKEVFKKELVKIVLSDFILPDGDGLDVLKIKSKDCALIIMTCNGNEELAVQSIKMGADNYLVKNIEFYEKLSGRIEETLKKYKEEKKRSNLISEIEKKNQKLVELNKKLKKLDKIKSEFISIASHELRTPLTIIREFVSLTKDGVGGEISSEQDEYLQTALDNCDRLSEIVENLLDLQKIKSGKINIRRKKCNLSEIVLHCYNDFKFRVKSKNQMIEVLNRADNTFVIGDKFRITQVLTNLVENAHKYAFEGARIKIQITQKDDYVRVGVLDNGPGIKKKVVNDVFKAFTQVQSENNGENSGTGLGLTIAKNIIELHDGNIDVTTEPDKGCNFFFTIPLYTEEREVEAFFQDTTRSKEDKSKLTIVKICGANDSVQLNKLELLGKLNDRILDGMNNRKIKTMIIRSEMLLIMMITKGLDIKNEISSMTKGELADDILIFFKSLIVTRSDVTFNKLRRESRHMKLIYPERISGKILVVHDDHQVLKTIKTGLERSDMDVEVITASRGYDACIISGNIKPDLVILDVVIPGEDMRQILTRIRKSSYVGRTRIMVISGYPRETEKMMELGADEFLTKPFELSILTGKVKAMLKENYTGKEIHKMEQTKP